MSIARAALCAMAILGAALARADERPLQWLNRYTVHVLRPDDDLKDEARRKLYARCSGHLRRGLAFDVREVDSPDDGLVSGPTSRVRVAVPIGEPCAEPGRQSDFEAGRFAR